jgi:hypothetical protein
MQIIPKMSAKSGKAEGKRQNAASRRLIKAAQGCGQGHRTAEWANREFRHRKHQALD